MDATIYKTVPENGDGEITTVAFRANTIDGGKGGNKTYEFEDPGQYLIITT